MNTVVAIDADRITDWDSFHSVFAEAFGFPGFYVRDLDAWNDCMSSLDAPDDALSTVHVKPGNVLTLLIEHVSGFRTRCPQQYAALIECSAFVNWRRIEKGHPPVLALAFA